MPVTNDDILNALRSVQDPDLHKDIVSLGFVKDVKNCDGHVAFTIELTTPACPVREQMKQQAHAVVSKLPGVRQVDIQMTAQVRNTLLQQNILPGVRNVVPIGSGKGGVGKSTVSANLALALAKMGAKVGLMDADIYGPSIPAILGVTAPPQLHADQRLRPATAHGIVYVSFGFFLPPGKAYSARGPMLTKWVDQFIGAVEWGPLDYLIVDLPPGTGDVQISLCQRLALTGAAIVSTPQDVALNIATKCIDMFRILKTPVLGLIENMSGYACPKCGHHDDIFGAGGARAAAERIRYCKPCNTDLTGAAPPDDLCPKCKEPLERVPFLGSVPLATAVRTTSDAGCPIVVADPGHPAAQAFMRVAEALAAQVSIRGFRQDEPQLQPVVWGKPS